MLYEHTQSQIDWVCLSYVVKYQVTDIMLTTTMDILKKKRNGFGDKTNIHSFLIIISSDLLNAELYVFAVDIPFLRISTVCIKYKLICQNLTSDIFSVAGEDVADIRIV